MTAVPITTMKNLTLKIYVHENVHSFLSLESELAAGASSPFPMSTRIQEVHCYTLRRSAKLTCFWGNVISGWAYKKQLDSFTGNGLGALIKELGAPSLFLLALLPSATLGHSAPLLQRRSVKAQP